MKLVFNTNIVSPHSVPLALKWFSRHLSDSCTYLYHGEEGDRFRTENSRKAIRGFGVCLPYASDESHETLSKADILYDNVRDLDIFEIRMRQNRMTFYSSERWFKPIRIDAPRKSERAKGRGVCISGFIKLLHPVIFKRISRMVKIMKSKCGNFIYLPIGIHAARDMARVCGLFHGDLRCLLRAPDLVYERKVGGRIWAVDGNDHRYCLDKMRMWGYFVEASDLSKERSCIEKRRVLWVGRMLGCKRLDTLIRAVGGLERVELDIYGDGADELRVRKMAARYPNIHIYDPIPLSRVRELMRDHDVYVFSSNEVEGWGAVVNEALEEGMLVLGTYEAGSSATILPSGNLFHAGDWRTLREKLESPIPAVDIGCWTVDNAANQLVKLFEEFLASSNARMEQYGE